MPGIAAGLLCNSCVPSIGNPGEGSYVKIHYVQTNIQTYSVIRV